MPLVIIRFEAGIDGFVALVELVTHQIEYQFKYNLNFILSLINKNDEMIG